PISRPRGWGGGGRWTRVGRAHRGVLWAAGVVAGTVPGLVWRPMMTGRLPEQGERSTGASWRHPRLAAAPKPRLSRSSNEIVTDLGPGDGDHPRPTTRPTAPRGESVAGGQRSAARTPPSTGRASKATSLTRERSARAPIHVPVRCQSTRLKILCSGHRPHPGDQRGLIIPMIIQTI